MGEAYNWVVSICLKLILILDENLHDFFKKRNSWNSDKKKTEPLIVESDSL